MRLKEAREQYYEFSGKLSDVNRQLGFAGIAVVWIFAQGDGDLRLSIPAELLFPLLLFVLGLALDVSHYASAAVLWGWYHRSRERMGASEDCDVSPHRAINWPAIFFFWTKVLSVAAGYLFLLHALWGFLPDAEA